MTATKPKFTWRVTKITGMIRTPVIHTLHVDGKPTDMIVQGELYDNTRFFWYGHGRNTHGNRVDLKTAKAQALEHFKKVRGYNRETT